MYDLKAASRLFTLRFNYAGIGYNNWSIRQILPKNQTKPI